MHFLIACMVLLFFIICFVYNYPISIEAKKIENKIKEKYVDLGDEITSEIQNSALQTIIGVDPKLDTINNSMTTTNNLLNQIISSQSTALNNITTTVSENMSKLTNMNKGLDLRIKQVRKKINGTVIAVSENFEDVSDIYDNPNNKTHNLKKNKKNDMNNKEKLTEYFYNYVPPKQNVYEGFADWRPEWKRKVKDIGLSLEPVSTIKEGKYNDYLPIVSKKDMPKTMNETTAKIISLTATNDANKLLQSWRKSLRKEESDDNYSS